MGGYILLEDISHILHVDMSFVIIRNEPLNPVR